jgi:hypothetical protein
LQTWTVGVILDLPMHVVNWIFRARGHKYACDLETLTMVLTEAGLVDVALYAQARNPDGRT